MTLEKIHPSEKEQICEKIYKNYIIKSSETLLQYEIYANTAEVRLPVGCYTNFRDALFHFRRLASSSEKREVEAQAFAIKEHLSRALTDAATVIVDMIAYVAEQLLKEGDLNHEQEQQVRKMLHQIKRAILRKRFSGMMLSNDGIKIEHSEILELIDCFFDFANCSYKEEFAKYSRRYVTV